MNTSKTDATTYSLSDEDGEKREALYYLAEETSEHHAAMSKGEFTDEDMAEFKDAFSLFDRVGDGKINSWVLGDIVRALGLNPSTEDVEKAIDDVDPDGGSRITFEEFLSVFVSMSKIKQAHSVTVNDCVEAFKVFDKDSIGVVQSAEVRRLLTGLGDKLTDEEVEVLSQLFEDNKGQINYENMIKNVVAN